MFKSEIARDLEKKGENENGPPLINACSLEISLIGWIHVNIAEKVFKTSFRSTVLI